MSKETSDERISGRIRTRVFFGDILLLIAQEADEHCAEKEYLFSLFRDYFAEKKNQQPVEVECMGESERKNFEKFQMPFGVYEGDAIAEVPLPYLCFITDSANPYREFKNKLKRYLKSPRITNEIKNG